MENEENQNQVFPSFPTGLGNRFAIPTFPPLRRLLMFLKGAPNTNPRFQPFQAHSSMRKCCSSDGFTSTVNCHLLRSNIPELIDSMEHSMVA
jgi:hypothetical protein